MAKSPITLQEFEQLKHSATFTEEDEHWLRMAGDILADQTEELVGKWREVIAAQNHLEILTETGWRERRSLFREERITFSAMGARYLFAPVRSGLA